jgi:S1-C subfamily serine protease
MDRRLGFFCGCLLACAFAIAQERPITDPAAGAPLVLRQATTTAADLLVLQARIQQVVAQATPATIAFEGGTGVIVQPDGLALTCAHVNVEAGRTFEVFFADGRTAQARSLGNHHGLDAGMVQLLGDGPWPFVPMADDQSTLLGSWCVALGYAVSFAEGQPPAVRFGRIHYHDGQTIISDCPIMGGDSGGPLLNLDGRLIGICSSCDEDVRDNASVPMNVFREYWDRMRSGEDIDLDSEAMVAGQFRDSLTQAFDQVAHGANSAVMRVLDDNQPVALATLVPGDRLAVTKSSLVTTDAIVCVTNDGDSIPAEVIHRDSATDLAVLRLNEVPAAQPIQWQETSAQPGTLVASLDELGQAAGLGVVMTEPRIFDTDVPPPGRGYLGVAFDLLPDGGAVVTEVQSGSAAETAAISVGDRIRAVDGAKLDDQRTLSQVLGGTHPEQTIQLTVERNGQPSREIPVTLGTPPSMQQMLSDLSLASTEDEEVLLDAQDAWGGGPFSERRFGFPRVIAHDTALTPDAAGGPLIDAHGNVLGINIARALRVASYAIPLPDVQRVVEAAAE